VCDTEAEEVQVEVLEAAGIEVVRLPGVRGRLDLHAVLEVLGTRKILSVLLECGSELNGAFLAQGLVDKVVLFHGNTKFGEGAVPFAVGIGSPGVVEQAMKGVVRTMFGENACVVGYLRDPWGSVAGAE
jgi:diaminohydroxyphosphoribosylaminopyrimidine deaminase/5-amino-6-(5-phosphoribosylamino)uracil reductase